jgi:23S rRNA (guanosine2251-2'-O)-methyltransferase
MAKPGRPGAGKPKKKGPIAGTGGHNRRALEGKGPTPKATDRTWHVAGKRKACTGAAGCGNAPSTAGRPASSGGTTGASQGKRPGRPKSSDDSEMVTGPQLGRRGAAREDPGHRALRVGSYRVRRPGEEALSLATKRGLPVLEVMRPELDRMSGRTACIRASRSRCRPMSTRSPETWSTRLSRGARVPLLVALDGVTDPRNLGAIVRSVAAFGGQGVDRSPAPVGRHDASAWKTSAGAASRIRVAMASNLTNTLKDLKSRGLFVLGLDGGGDVSLPGLELATRPLVLVVGSEGKGLSRLVTETCDAVVSIPIESSTESLNAGIAVSVALYEVSKLRTTS